MKRVLFVGVHNKPGMKPLDSMSRSGKLIDRCIKELKHVKCVKTNLHDVDYYPLNYDAYKVVNDWAYRVSYTSDDLVICLGQCVRNDFRKSKIPFIGVGHPSATWSNDAKDTYIKRIKHAVEFSTGITQLT